MRAVSDGRGLKLVLFAVFVGWMLLVIANAVAHGPAKVDTALLCVATAATIAIAVAARSRGKPLSVATVADALVVAIGASAIVLLGFLLGIGR